MSSESVNIGSSYWVANHLMLRLMTLPMKPSANLLNALTAAAEYSLISGIGQSGSETHLSLWPTSAQASHLSASLGSLLCLNVSHLFLRTSYSSIWKRTLHVLLT